MGIISHINNIRQHDPSVKSIFEIMLYPSIWAMGFHRVAHVLYRFRLRFLARLVSQISRWFTGIEIHPGARIGRCLFIDHGMGVVIGETCTIGDYVTIFQGATLGGTGKESGKRHPTIGNHVLIGAGAKVLGSFTVGDRSRVGAGSVVLQEVPPDCTVVGVPGRIVKTARKDQAGKLDHAHMPDPLTMELNKLTKRIEELEEELKACQKNHEPNKEKPT